MVKVKNRLGLHIRPATAIVKMLQGARSSVQFAYKGQEVNAKSIMSLLVLAAQRNAQISVTVEGEDAEIVMNRIMSGFETKFGE